MADEILLGGVAIHPVERTLLRMSMMIWGKSGTGKTTFACTAPGQKLILNFDPDGPQSVVSRDDVIVADYSDQTSHFVERLTGEDPLKLDRFLEEHTEIETVILDSATSLGQLALVRAVNKTKSATMELPGIPGYTARNIIMLQTIRALLAVTKKHNRHFILIAHEDTPNTDSQGNIIDIQVLLSGKLPDHVPINLSEVWYLSDIKKIRKIAVRPCRLHTPMKTRMFVTNGEPEFILKYDQSKSDSDQEHTIANWYVKWQETGGRKLELPT